MRLPPSTRRSIRMALHVLSCLVISSAHADTAIETETAQIGKKGESNFSQAFEFENATDGSGQGTLTQYEYGLSDRAEILIEPFFYVRSAPDDGPAASGAGDLEITPSYMVVVEKAAVPAVLLAFKVKVPTGSKEVEGTGKVDYYPYLIFGKHFGGWTWNANVGVNFAQPVDDNTYQKNVVWDIEAERELAPHFTAFFEAFSAEDGVKTLSTSAEYQFTPRFNAFAVYSRTEEHSDVARIGFNYLVTTGRQ
jgi:Putative MetA-pathway of phenol degradation